MMHFIAALVLTLAATDSPRAQEEILGVRVGSALADVQAKLAPHGTGDSRRTRDGGTKQAWTLKGTRYSSVALRTDAAGRVVWITGFARPGHEIPFDELGDIARARTSSPTTAVWHVQRSDGGYRLIARGTDRRAQSISLLAFDAQAESRKPKNPRHTSHSHVARST